MPPQPTYIPLFTNGKRDKARRYIDSSTGEVVSRRKAENLTTKQAASRAAKKQTPGTATTPTPSKPDRFIVKKKQTLSHFTVYRIKAQSVEAAVRAYSSSKPAQRLKPAFIKVTARGMIMENNDSGHEDEQGRLNWRTIVSPTNPQDFLDRRPEVLEEARQGIAHSFDGAPVEYNVMLYVSNTKEK